MPDNNSGAVGVVGLDGHPPLYSPDARFAMWAINEIYRGEEGKNKHIPKINDLVVDTSTSNMFKVIDLDPVSMVPTLETFVASSSTSNDKVMSTTLDNFRIYYDKTVSPYTLNVDGFMHIYNPNASFARIYRGTEVNETKLISRKYDNNGNFLGHDIPLELVSYNSHDNYGVKSIPFCNTKVELVNGEPCLVVIYTSNGKVLTTANCIIDETTYIAQAFAEQKFVTQIFMKSVFVDAMQTGDVHYPVNLPVASFNPIGVVQYNDGSQVEYPVHGGKFKLFGLDEFVSTVIGHKLPLVLSYKLGNNESAIADVSQDGNFVTRPYNLIVSEPNRSYNVKLFVYPYWISEVSGYGFKAYLMNLDRDILYDVTNKVGLTPLSPPFSPLSYGVTQRLGFSLDLASLGVGFNSFLHIQTVDIVLRGPATSETLDTLWEVGTIVPSSVPYYGTGLKAVLNLDNVKKVNIANSFEDVETFVEATYRKTEPIYNPMTEIEAPFPTHIEVRHGEEVIFDKIENFKKDFVFSNEVPRLSNVDIIFYRESSTSYLKLGICPMTVR